jgi:hypothetical protein
MTMKRAIAASAARTALGFLATGLYFVASLR